MRSALLRCLGGVPLLFFGTIVTLTSIAFLFLTLPVGVMLLGLGWWLLTGARQPESRTVRLMIGLGFVGQVLVVLAVMAADHLS